MKTRDGSTSKNPFEDTSIKDEHLSVKYFFRLWRLNVIFRSLRVRSAFPLDPRRTRRGSSRPWTPRASLGRQSVGLGSYPLWSSGGLSGRWRCALWCVGQGHSSISLRLKHASRLSIWNLIYMVEHNINEFWTAGNMCYIFVFFVEISWLCHWI